MPTTTRTWDCFLMRSAAAWMRANSSRSYCSGRATQPVKSPPGPLPAASMSAAFFRPV